MTKKAGKKCMSEGGSTGKVGRVGLDNRTFGERAAGLVQRAASGKSHQNRSANDSAAVVRKNKAEKPR